MTVVIDDCEQRVNHLTVFVPVITICVHELGVFRIWKFAQYMFKGNIIWEINEKSLRSPSRRYLYDEEKVVHKKQTTKQTRWAFFALFLTQVCAKTS